MDHRRRSVRRKPIPISSKDQRNRRLRPKEPQTDDRQVRLSGVRREPTGVARPRPEPRIPEELAPREFKTAQERRQALTGAAVRTWDKWGPVATPAPILILGPLPKESGARPSPSALT